jgi:hypothetical protein
VATLAAAGLGYDPATRLIPGFLPRKRAKSATAQGFFANELGVAGSKKLGFSPGAGSPFAEAQAAQKRAQAQAAQLTEQLTEDVDSDTEAQPQPDRTKQGDCVEVKTLRKQRGCGKTLEIRTPTRTRRITWSQKCPSSKKPLP